MLHSPPIRIPFAAIVAILVLEFPPAASGDPSGAIAFLNGPSPGDLKVCILEIDSGRIETVGVGPMDGRPAWSPVGTRLAHAFDSNGERRIRVVNADGSGAVVLDAVEGPARTPKWSPDGTRIAYVAGLANEERIYVCDLASRSTTLWGGTRVALFQPEWASDDRLVAVGRIGSPGSQTTDLFWVSRGRADRIADAQPEHGKYAEWAPASPGVGDFLAYESDDGGDREIYVYVPQNGPIDVSNHRAADWNPRWSPDRRTIAFESFRDGRRGIFRVNALRAIVEAVSPSEMEDAWDPNWSPDGEWIVYVSNESGAAKLYATQASGGDTVHLTDAEGVHLAPAWRPVR